MHKGQIDGLTITVKLYEPIEEEEHKQESPNKKSKHIHKEDKNKPTKQ